MGRRIGPSFPEERAGKSEMKLSIFEQRTESGYIKLGSGWGDRGLVSVFGVELNGQSRTRRHSEACKL